MDVSFAVKVGLENFPDFTPVYFEFESYIITDCPHTMIYFDLEKVPTE